MLLGGRKLCISWWKTVLLLGTVLVADCCGVRWTLGELRALLLSWTEESALGWTGHVF